MDDLLITVTVLALAVALGMGLVAARFLREERRRSNARIALLNELASDGPAQGTRRTPMSAGDLDLRPAPRHVSGVAEMFVEREPSSRWRPRLAIAGILAAAVAGMTFGVGKWQSTEADPPRAAAEAAPAHALELVSLRHVQQPGTLTITGLVQNPRGGAALSKVTATAFLFDANGAFLASGRAPLDFTALPAGEESPFVISVPVTGPVARYRIGFRDQDGGVISHVDRRSGATVASAIR
jgi:hypothetical protein